MTEVFLKDIGSDKVQVIKVYCEVTGMGLEEAKEVIDGVESGTPAKIEVDSTLVSSIIARFSEAGANAVISDSYFDSGTIFQDTDFSSGFKMVVEDVFEITGKGTVATGCISSGVIKLNDQVQINHGDGSSITSTVIGIEQSHSLLEKARQGENIGLLLSGLHRYQIAAGDVIVCKNIAVEKRELTEEKPFQKIAPSEKNTNNTVNVAKFPTASPQNREETLNMLYEVGRIAGRAESLAAERASIEASINSEKSKAEALRHIVSSKAKVIKWLAILCSLITWFFMNIFGVVVTIIVWIVMNKTVIKKDLQVHEIENNANAEKYIAEHIKPLESQLKKVKVELVKLDESGQIEWAKDIVGEDMFYSVCIGDLYDLVKSRRADSLKEALNLYDDAQYKARMEERQAAIQNASEMTAVEAAKQTAYSKEIAKNTHQTATASKASAYHTRQIDKNTRKFR